MPILEAGDPLKIHVGPDGSFAAFNGDGKLVAESPDDLYRVLIGDRRVEKLEKKQGTVPRS
jgi:hypothetical protein